MKIILATDAWEPQVNGVVRTLRRTVDILRARGTEVEVIHPGLFSTFRCPMSHDVDLVKRVPRSFLKKSIQAPCAVHVSTEGPLGWAVVRYCYRNKIPYTTAYHTNFPEYMWEHAWVPKLFTIGYLRLFHRTSQSLMVATPTLANKLARWGFSPQKLKIWSRGVDLELFHPREKLLDRKKPLALYVGRVSKEKNIDAFLSANADVEKYVVGDGPELRRLKLEYPRANFLGMLHGEDLARIYAEADVFCFPSKTDTFGLVVLEALASGVPVAAYPVEGPQDIIGGHTNDGVGWLSEDLSESMKIALQIGKTENCRQLAEQYSWDATTDQFVGNLAPYVT